MAANGRTDNFFGAAGSLVLLFAAIFLGIYINAGRGGSPVPLLFGLGMMFLLGIFYWKVPPLVLLRQGILPGIRKVAQAIVVVMLVGLLVAWWIESGTIPTLVSIGLNHLTGSWFYLTCFLVCGVVSLAIGTSFGTMAIAGIALMVVAQSFGASPPITAGAILSGSFLGDKMSPLSDTTNIAAAMGEVDLFRHIGSMMYSTLPAAVATMLVLSIFDWKNGIEAITWNDAYLTALNQHWEIHPWHLLPLLIMVLMVAFKWPAQLILGVTVAVGGIWAWGFQDRTAWDLILSGWNGFQSETGIRALDNAFTRGGAVSMVNVALIIASAGGLGGCLDVCGVIRILLRRLTNFVQTPLKLVASVMISCYGILVISGSLTLGLVMPGKVFLPIFREMRIDPRVLTRTLEDTATLASPLVPWSGVAAMVTTLLGVTVADYYWCYWLAMLVPVFSVLLAVTGVGIWYTHDQAGSDQVSKEQ